MGKTPHPYHYWEDKNLIQRLIDFLVPAGLFFLYFYFYNFGKFTPSEMVKTTGLWSISLLALTLVVGPLSRLFPTLTVLKAHRKVWGILSFLIALLHLSLVYIFYYKFSFSPFVNFSSPKYTGLLSGLLALVILLLVTLTSNQKTLTKLSPKVWKAIQLTSYLALFLALLHFYLMETTGGVLVIKRLLGRITLWFALATILARLVVLFLPKKR